MEDTITSLCDSLSAVLTHADDSSRALSDSLDRRPIPLESTASVFLQGLERRVAAGGADLARLESMAFGTVSFEELLGHCGESLSTFSRVAAAAESRLSDYGYVPREEGDEEEEADGDGEELPRFLDDGCFGGGSSSVLRSRRERVDANDALFEDSMSLKDLGFSDACLATLSSKDDVVSERSQILYKMPESVDDHQKNVNEVESTVTQEETIDPDNACQGLIRASKEEYEKLPPYMKTLASWEELQEAVEKLNSYFCGDNPEALSLNQNDVATVGLGRKGRSYLLILLRLNQLAMKNVDGSTFYILRKDDS